MAFSPEDIVANREYFAAKLRAEKQKADVAKLAKGEGGDFVLVDTRPREAFAKAHIRGSVNVPLAEVPSRAGELPRDRELVTYCWNRT